MSTTATIATGLGPALSSYAARLHKHASGDNQIVSPLGAWMLLALCARGSDGRLRDELTRVLGMDVELAATAVASLLEKPHPAVATGAGIWTSPRVEAEALAGWLAQLPVPIDRGTIPSKATLDEWAAKRTLGMIREFPGEVTPITDIVLATALASKVLWVEPFRTAPARELAGSDESEWSRQISRVLRAPSAESHTQFIAATDRAGDVCVHGVLARESLFVVSVIAERSVAPSDVMMTAYDLAVAAARQRPVTARSLFDLPLGDSPMWSITEEEILGYTSGEREEICTSVIPAWSGHATLDLSRPELGFPAAAAHLARLMHFDRYDYQAKQSVMARYNRKGFEAAAVSAMTMSFGAARPPRERGLLRRATLRFGHPFAVVAVTRAWTDWIGDRSGRTRASEFWHGLPVYSAWVTVPVEAEDDDDEKAVDVEDRSLTDEYVRFVQSASAPRLEDAQAAASRGPWSSRALDLIKRLGRGD